MLWHVTYFNSELQLILNIAEGRVCGITATVGNMLQIALVGFATWQFKTGASPWDRLRILPIFFLGSAELASGLVGL